MAFVHGMLAVKCIEELTRATYAKILLISDKLRFKEKKRMLDFCQECIW
jgi:hypothetical protein